MADTSQQELSEPHTNGVIDGLTEEEKSKMRPADIDADMREMERRKRVEMMMNSRLFREELERIIETQMKDGSGPSGLLQQISEMMGPQGARFNANVFKNSNCVVPINDIRGVESMGYAKGEKLLRCKLAAVFRLLDLYGWTQGVGGQITARLNQDQEHFLVNPYGLLYHEITASSLVKVDMQGTVVEQGTTNFGVHIAGFQLHSTIHAARPDIKCIVHIATPSVTAVSSMKCGLLPLGQESIVIGEVSNHQYVGGAFEPEEREKITRNLGPISKVMLLTNRGALCCGETVEEAFFNVYNTVLACETQLKLLPAGLDNMNLISEESKKAIFEASRKPPIPQQSSIVEPSPLAEKLEKRWRIGGTEFEALMRMLDNAGFRTGYIYRHPLVKSEPPRPRNDVEVPPAVSSLGYLLEEEELYKQGLWKGGRKGTDRTRWLNSPNVYQKVEILETGTPDPKKITKWVTDGSPTHSSTPVKIDSALQFVPKNTNPKEFKQLQQQIKDYRRADKISAGPQSHILEGVTWEEAKKMQDATISGTGEQVVLVGAASKGIIQRGFQHNAMVYKTPYAKNPFDAITDQELDQYKKDVERKQKGDPYDESQSESEALSSFNISRATHESSTAKSPIQSPVSVTSETEEESRDEPRVLRIATKQVPVPSQPEVVLSDVDATTQFLTNEMRRSAIESRNNVNKRGVLDNVVTDIGQSSTCSSEIEGFTYSSWQSSESADNPRLEVTKSTTVAEIMKPVLMKIESSTISSKIENNVKHNENSRPYHNTRHNNILKREFFANYEKRINKNNLLDSIQVEKSRAIISDIIDDGKLGKTNVCNNANVTANGSLKVNENGIDKHRNNSKNKKINPVVKYCEDKRDENISDKTEQSLKNIEERLDNDGIKSKDLENKPPVAKFKKRCARKLNIPSKISNTDNSFKSSVIKTHFHPLIRCSDVISSTDSDSISKSSDLTKSDFVPKIMTVNCNIDHFQEINFTQHLNIDFEEQVDSDFESEPLSPGSLSEPLRAPTLVQQFLDTRVSQNVEELIIDKNVNSNEETIPTTENKTTEQEQFLVNTEISQDAKESINYENIGRNKDTSVMENETNKEKQFLTDTEISENVKNSNFENIENIENIEDMISAVENEITKEEKEIFVNTEVFQDGKKFINYENIDRNENTSAVENKTNDEIAMIKGFNDGDNYDFQSEHNEEHDDHDNHDHKHDDLDYVNEDYDRSVIDGNGNSSDEMINNSIDKNRCLHSKTYSVESITETKKSILDGFEKEISSCENEKLKNNLEVSESLLHNNDTFSEEEIVFKIQDSFSEKEISSKIEEETVIVIDEDNVEERKTSESNGQNVLVSNSKENESTEQNEDTAEKEVEKENKFTANKEKVDKKKRKAKNEKVLNENEFTEKQEVVEAKEFTEKQEVVQETKFTANKQKAGKKNRKGKKEKVVKESEFTAKKEKLGEKKRKAKKEQVMKENEFTEEKEVGKENEFEKENMEQNEDTAEKEVTKKNVFTESKEFMKENDCDVEKEVVKENHFAEEKEVLKKNEFVEQVEEDSEFEEKSTKQNEDTVEKEVMKENYFAEDKEDLEENEFEEENTEQNENTAEKEVTKENDFDEKEVMKENEFAGEKEVGEENEYEKENMEQNEDTAEKEVTKKNVFTENKEFMKENDCDVEKVVEENHFAEEKEVLKKNEFVEEVEEESEFEEKSTKQNEDTVEKEVMKENYFAEEKKDLEENEFEEGNTEQNENTAENEVTKENDFDEKEVMKENEFAGEKEVGEENEFEKENMEQNEDTAEKEVTKKNLFTENKEFMKENDCDVEKVVEENHFAEEKEVLKKNEFVEEVEEESEFEEKNTEQNEDTVEKEVLKENEFTENKEVAKENDFAEEKKVITENEFIEEKEFWEENEFEKENELQEGSEVQQKQKSFIETVENNIVENKMEDKNVSQDPLEIKYEDFVKEISSSSSEGEIHSPRSEESFHLKELFSNEQNEIASEQNTFDGVFNAEYENMEGFEGFPLQKSEGSTNVGNIEVSMNEIFTFKHSDIDLNNLFSKVCKEIVHKKNENCNKSSQKSNLKKDENLNTCPEKENNELISSTSSSECHERRDSITDMINNMNVNVSSSITTFENLPETENSSKYNLDRTNMSLLYSLTPSAEISPKICVSSKNTSVEMKGLSLNSFECLDQLDSSRSLRHDVFDWLDLASVKIKRDSILNTDKPLYLIQSCLNMKFFNESSSEEISSDIENISTQGSDILELPSSTYLELKKNEDESFHQELKSSVNEIINDLGEQDIFTLATNFVDDLIYDLNCLNMYIDMKNLRHEAMLLMKNRIYAFLIVNDIVKKLISSLPVNDQNELNSQFENLQSNDGKQLIEEDGNSGNFIVIQEMIHHIIDKFDDDNPTVRIPKKLKETVNIELKKCPNKKLENNEEIGLEGLLKNMKDDDILPCDCLDCLPTENEELLEIQKDKECMKQLLHLITNNENQEEGKKLQEENFVLKSQEMKSNSNEDSSESDDEDVLNLKKKLMTMFSDNKDKKSTPLSIKLNLEESDSCEDQTEFQEKTNTLNSSPTEVHSAGSENFAEQEVTSESTDNDTKSDTSREKEMLRFEEDKNGNHEILSDHEIKSLWVMREDKIEETCKNERFQFLEKSPSFIHFGDFYGKEEQSFCTCCLEASTDDEVPSKLPPIEELNESMEFSNCDEKPFDQSLISPKSGDFFTCRDTCETSKSNIQSEIDTTKELMDNLDDPFQDNSDGNQNATYTISDVSDNDKTSELEYNADVSSNLEAQKLGESAQEIMRDNNNTTLNFADISASTMISDKDLKINKNSLTCDNLETSQEINPCYKNPVDYMTYSYDTKEFMKLEKHLEEQDKRLCCNFKKSEFTSFTSPPKYEETSLYRVVTQMNLADTDSYSSFSVNNDSCDTLE